MQTIHVSTGATEYTLPVTLTERTGKNIAADTIRLSLGTDTTPGTVWLAPSLDPVQTDPSKRVVQLLIDVATLPGTYYLWLKINDDPEVAERRAHKIIVA